MKRVGIAELKAKLSEYLRHVRRGDSLTVVDRRAPIARIVPYSAGFEPLQIRAPTTAARPADIALPPPTELGFDVVDLLMEDRSSGR
jgi:prevent-host-death family protein